MSKTVLIQATTREKCEIQVLMNSKWRAISPCYAELTLVWTILVGPSEAWHLPASLCLLLTWIAARKLIFTHYMQENANKLAHKLSEGTMQ